MEANIQGRGIDNHLLGLREAARETLGHLPDMFTDNTYNRMIEFKLSTSQVSYKGGVINAQTKFVDFNILNTCNGTYPNDFWRRESVKLAAIVTQIKRKIVKKNFILCRWPQPPRVRSWVTARLFLTAMAAATIPSVTPSFSASLLSPPPVSLTLKPSVKLSKKPSTPWNSCSRTRKLKVDFGTTITHLLFIYFFL